MYKFKVFDIDGCLIDSKESYGLVYDSYEEAEEQCLKEIESIEKSCREQFENPLLKGYNVLEVK